jgi:hypothetical protein
VDRFACDWLRLSTTDPKDSTGDNYIERIFKKQCFFPVFGKRQEKSSLFSPN